jgi:uncharacterized protein YdhG (YjbR/CyaY superfamily)
MQANRTAPKDIDAYISGFPQDIQKILQKLRTAIKKAAPGATEAISYQMPTFKLHGNLVHFAAFTNHIGFYPTPKGIDAFRSELAGYKKGKGSIQFPIDEPLPLDLITKIVHIRVLENTEKAEAKLKSKRKSK